MEKKSFWCWYLSLNEYCGAFNHLDLIGISAELGLEEVIIIF